MARQIQQGTGPGPRTEEVIREIRYFSDRIRDASRRGEQAGRSARDVYGPFLARRLKLLAALREGHGAAWREYPPATVPGAARGSGGAVSR